MGFLILISLYPGRPILGMEALGFLEKETGTLVPVDVPAAKAASL